MSTQANLEKPKGALKFVVYLAVFPFLAMLVRVVFLELYGK
jgi:hypothetical protein